MSTNIALNDRLIRLPFADGIQESEFLTFHYQKIRLKTRVSILLAMVMFILFVVLEAWMAGQIPSGNGPVHGIIIISWLALLLGATYTDFFYRHWNAMMIAVVFCTSIGVMAMMKLSPVANHLLYLMGLLFIILWTSLFSGVQFSYNLMINLLTILIYDCFLLFSQHASGLLLIHHSSFLLAAAGIGGFACYSLESHSRMLFLQGRSMQTMSEEFATSSEILQRTVDEKTRELQTTLTELRQINTAYNRFVPKDFLQHLGKDSIVNVELGNHSLQEMSVLFSDIYSFTSLSESMSPKDNFDFLNSYLSQIGPVVREYDGFIDKYIGDGIMAIFDKCASDAVSGAIAILEKLKVYNEGRKRAGYIPIEIGIGINTGKLMLGTIGEHHRMETTVISDSVNLASRIQGMTRIYGTPLLISDYTFHQLDNPGQFATRIVDRVIAKGRSGAVTLREVFNADPPAIRDAKYATAELIGRAFSLYYTKQLDKAAELFQQSLTLYPDDKVATIYLERCQHYLQVGLEDDWNGITTLEHK